MSTKRSRTTTDFTCDEHGGVRESSAAERAYGIKEIRQGIMQYLGKEDLARWMRVDKGRNEEFLVKQLYESVPYKAVQAIKKTGGVSTEVWPRKSKE